MVPRPLILAAAAFLALTWFLVSNLDASKSSSATFQTTEHGWQFNYSQHANAHSLTKSQCIAAFPRLFERIDAAVHRRIQEGDLVSPTDLEIPGGRCMLRVMIYEQELRIIDLGDPLECYVSNGRERITATLNLIQRALASTPADESVPNIEFPISYDDLPTRSTRGATWGFTRTENEENVWLIPDYGYWSWWAVGIPSFRSVWRQMRDLESSNAWQQKIKKAVWRGTTHFNPSIREKLVETAKDTAWGDVKVVSQGEKDQNFLTLDEHCRYQYVFQAEGTSYTGRFKFLQLCKSVTVAHKMEYAEFATHLLQAHGSEQNFIEVERDWSDLSRTMEHFLRYPQEAQAIAERSYELFNRRYLTPAAVSCYFRRLFDGWASIQGFEPEIFREGNSEAKEIRGIPFEAFAVSFPQERPGEYGRFAPS